MPAKVEIWAGRRPLADARMLKSHRTDPAMQIFSTCKTQARIRLVPYSQKYNLANLELFSIQAQRISSHHTNLYRKNNVQSKAKLPALVLALLMAAVLFFLNSLQARTHMAPRATTVAMATPAITPPLTDAWRQTSSEAQKSSTHNEHFVADVHCVQFSLQGTQNLPDLKNATLQTSHYPLALSQLVQFSLSFVQKFSASSQPPLQAAHLELSVASQVQQFTLFFWQEASDPAATQAPLLRLKLSLQVLQFSTLHSAGTRPGSLALD
ncbi:hypothetical protein SS50377_27896 [Spironucleus salmonicida]|uniref:Uncharacterized protein n=1 Tax=Spironucleus salmonicida TaxID=348837 RepID=A0A9P8LK99_9EUKA|nr:hypothetical protein SS50377_27896 [Spironucleus salmonicida]